MAVDTESINLYQYYTLNYEGIVNEKLEQNGNKVESRCLQNCCVIPHNVAGSHYFLRHSVPDTESRTVYLILTIYLNCSISINTEIAGHPSLSLRDISP